MKKANNLTLALFAITIGACSGQPSSDDSEPNKNSTSSVLGNSALAATWTFNGDQLVIGQNASISDTTCGYHGTVLSLAPSSSCSAGISTCGTASIHLSQTNGAGGCLPTGNASCTYATSFINNTDISLTLNCGGGATTYTEVSPPANPNRSDSAKTSYLPNGIYTAAGLNWCTNGACNSSSQPAACDGITTFSDFAIYNDAQATFFNSITEYVQIAPPQVTLTTSQTGHMGMGFSYQYLGGSPAQWEITYGTNCGRLYICHIGSCL